MVLFSPRITSGQGNTCPPPKKNFQIKIIMKGLQRSNTDIFETTPKINVLVGESALRGAGKTSSSSLALLPAPPRVSESQRGERQLNERGRGLQRKQALERWLSRPPTS